MARGLLHATSRPADLRVALLVCRRFAGGMQLPHVVEAPRALANALTHASVVIGARVALSLVACSVRPPKSKRWPRLYHPS
jgi:hypothetical protein